MSLIRPFCKNRPLSAAIYVDHDPASEGEPVSRLVSRAARNSAGDMTSTDFFGNLPMTVMVYDSRRELFIVYHAGEPPEASVCPVRAPTPPRGFPAAAPDEPATHLFGIPCHRRVLKYGEGTEETWYSYEYAVVVRSILRLPVHGTTTWRLDEVRLEEPPAELFSEAAILASGPERIRNIWRAAGEFFASTTEEGPEFRRDL